MISKPVLYIFFVLMVGVQLYTPTKMIIEQNDVLENGNAYKFMTEPVDPNDIFRGKYVFLRFKGTEVTVDSNQHWSYDQEVYVSLKKNNAGFAEFDDVYAHRPEIQNDYIQAKILSIFPDSHKIMLQLPFERLYMDEFDAPVAENRYLHSFSDSSSVAYVLVMVKNGKSGLKDLYINDVPVKTLISQHPKE